MNQTELEKVLTRAPTPSVPRALLSQLKAQIDLGSDENAEGNIVPLPSSGRQWLPLGIAAGFALCLGALAVQWHRLSELKEEQLVLHEELHQQPELSSQPLVPRSDNSRIERLKAEAAEVQKLEVEIVQLKQQLTDLQERTKRAAEAATLPQHPPMTKAPRDIFVQGPAEAQEAGCISNLKQLGIAARLYAKDHNKIYAGNLAQLQSYLQCESCSRCPSGQPYKSYLREATLEHIPDAVLVHCEQHNRVLVADGSVHGTGTLNHLLLRDGHPYLKRP